VPQRIYLPPILDPIYGFPSVNVEAQEGESSSLLNWMRRMVAVRSQSRAFGRGEIRFLYPSNRKVLAYVREYEGERILCVANLSRSAQAVELDLSDFIGVVPVELIGRTAFPPIGDLPYLLTLPAYGFYWFVLEEEAELPHWHEAIPEILPDFITLTASDGGIKSVLSGRERTQLERDVLPEFLPLQRWYGDKQERIRSVAVTLLAPVDNASCIMTTADVTTGAGQSRYFLPLQMRWGDENLRPGAPLLSHTLAKVRKGPRLGALVDAAFDDEFALALIAAIRRGEPIAGGGGRVEFDSTEALKMLDTPNSVRRLGAEQSNVSVVLDSKVMLKIYRRIQKGLQPDVEVGRFLTEKAGFKATPAYLGSATYVTDTGDRTTLATAFAFVYNQGDAWSGLLDALVRDLEHGALAAARKDEPFAYPLNIARVLGLRTAELHAAFSQPSEDPGFAIEPVGNAALKAWAGTISDEVRRSLATLRDRASSLPPTAAPEIQALLAAEDELLAQVSFAASLKPAGRVSRIHGDYHLGQVLICQDDVMIVDFEGEPQRTLDDRREKSSPLRDVAGMLRSFDYLSWAALDRRREFADGISDAEERRALFWRDQAQRNFLDAYFERSWEIAGRRDPHKTVKGLLRLFLIQKAAYEVAYEAANRPAWLHIPIRGILNLLKQEAS
jgi:maltose alpha-D-glucosyltransferase/alpha-amylase